MIVLLIALVLFLTFGPALPVYGGQTETTTQGLSGLTVRLGEAHAAPGEEASIDLFVSAESLPDAYERLRDWQFSFRGAQIVRIDALYGEEKGDALSFVNLRNNQAGACTAAGGSFASPDEILSPGGVRIATIVFAVPESARIGDEIEVSIHLFEKLSFEDADWEPYYCQSSEAALASGKICVDLSQHTQHRYSAVSTAAPTCTEGGYTIYVCSVCGDSYRADETDPLGHKPVTDAAVAATCTETGLTEGSHCSVCNAVLTTQTVVPAKGHTPVTDAAVAATCTETGLTAGKHCSVCGEILVAQTVVPAKGHTPVTDAAVAATCTETGLTAGKHCSVCGEILVAQTVVPAKGHTPVTDAAVAATCTETGLTEGSHCSVCNAVLTAQTVVPAKGHTPVTDAAVAAT